MLLVSMVRKDADELIIVANVAEARKVMHSGSAHTTHDHKLGAGRPSSASEPKVAISNAGHRYA